MHGFNPFCELAGEIESHCRFAVTTEDKFLIFGQITLKQVFLHFFHTGFMFEPQRVRTVCTILIFAYAENAVAGALICDIDIEVLADFIRERHCFFHKNTSLKKYLFMIACILVNLESSVDLLHKHDGCESVRERHFRHRELEERRVFKILV